MQPRNVGVLIDTAGHMVDVAILVTSVIPRLKDTRMKRFLIIKWGVPRHIAAEGVSQVMI